MGPRECNAGDVASWLEKKRKEQHKRLQGIYDDLETESKSRPKFIATY